MNGYLELILMGAWAALFIASIIWIVGRSLIRFYFAHKSRYIAALEASLDQNN
jgi:hypothetical protein